MDGDLIYLCPKDFVIENASQVLYLQITYPKNKTFVVSKYNCLHGPLHSKLLLEIYEEELVFLCATEDCAVEEVLRFMHAVPGEQLVFGSVHVFKYANAAKYLLSEGISSYLIARTAKNYEVIITQVSLDEISRKNIDELWDAIFVRELLEGPNSTLDHVCRYVEKFPYFLDSNLLLEYGSNILSSWNYLATISLPLARKKRLAGGADGGSAGNIIEQELQSFKGTVAMRDPSPCSHRVALVTGAGAEHGIGFATARALAKAGNIVVLTSTTARIHERVAQLAAEVGGSPEGYVADLMAPDAAAWLIRQVVAKYGRLDVVVNNAGMVAVGGIHVEESLESTTDALWRDGIDRNLTTAFSVTRAAAPMMRRQSYGRIINVASTSGPVQAFIGDVAYHAAKAGMMGLTRATALELAADGVTVNAVAPGWIATDSQMEFERAAGGLAAVGRSGTAEEVASVIAFLASPAASYATGQLVVVDGGNSLPEDRAWRPLASAPL